MKSVSPAVVATSLLIITAQWFVPNAVAQDCQPVGRGQRQAVVHLSVTATVKTTGAVREQGGTGFIVSSQGYVLTNNHVVSTGADTDQLRLMGSIASKTAFKSPLEVLAQNEHQDIALLRFLDTSVQYKAVKLGNPWSIGDGEMLCSGGFPLDLDYFVTSGVLGGKNGPKGWWVSQITSNPGESGAPVFNKAGEVVAVKTAGRTDANNINLLVPINMAAPFLLLAGIDATTLVQLSQAPSSGRAPGTERIECKVDQGRESQGGLAPSSAPYEAHCAAKPGYRIVKAELVRLSENNLSDVDLTVVPDGTDAVLRYRLTSGPFYDRVRGWLNGVIVTEQVAR